MLINFLACVVYCETVSKYFKIRNQSGGNNSIKPFQLYLREYRLAFGLFLNLAIQIILEICLDSGAPNENIVQNHLNIALLNLF